jgi:tetratricopeptide (TPR) repeat protein
MDIVDIGSAVRKKRTEKKLTLEELATKLPITSGSLSKFERGILSLEKEKIDRILEVLEIRHEDIQGILDQIEKEESVSLLVFLSIEAQVKQDTVKSLKSFNEQLKRITKPIAEKFLRAKRFFVRKDYDNAIRFYQQVIETNDLEYCPKANLKSSAFLDLSVIQYVRGNYAESLKLLQKGLDSSHPTGERRHVLHSIHYNRSLILYELGKIEEADRSLEPAWSQRNKMEEVLTRIKVYELKASIKRDQGKRPESRRILQKALSIATMNNNPDGAYYVFVDLAKLALESDELDYSEACFLAAIHLEKKLQKDSPTSAYLGLSQLYRDQGEQKKARKMAAKAVKHAKKSKDIPKLIEAYKLEASIYEGDGNFFDSCNNYKAALELARKYRFDHYKPELYEHLYSCAN